MIPNVGLNALQAGSSQLPKTIVSTTLRRPFPFFGGFAL
jgi:hypothetical protein